MATADNNVWGGAQAHADWLGALSWVCVGLFFCEEGQWGKAASEP